MANSNGFDWYSGLSWLLWLGVLMLIFSIVGNWGYTYRAHRRVDDQHSSKRAIDLLNERYAQGLVGRDEFHRIRAEISTQGFTDAYGDQKKSA